MISLSVPEEKAGNSQNLLETELNRLMEAYGNDVLRTCHMFLKDRHKAEDAFQEIFLKVYRNLDRFSRRSSEKTWIMSIAINQCKDMLRSSWVKRVMLSDEPKSRSKGADIANSVIRQDENRRLYETVLALPQGLKEVVILYYYQEFDTKEIARILRTAEGTVRSRLHRARDVLRNVLEGRLDLGE